MLTTILSSFTRKVINDKKTNYQNSCKKEKPLFTTMKQKQKKMLGP